MRAAEEASRKQIELEKRAADAELLKLEQDRKFTSLKVELDAGIVAFKSLKQHDRCLSFSFF